MGYKEMKKEFMDFMLKSGVLTFGDFTTKSGRKTPYFVNTGLYNTGDQLVQLGEFYADMVQKSGQVFDALYGPAYKGIPLVVVTAAELARKYQRSIPYFFNRKEEKDHGEGGTIIGYTPKDDDRIAIIEDVVTAGTAVRESITLLNRIADVKVVALYVSVDRCERGATTDLSALEELQKEFGINTYSILNALDIVDILKHDFNLSPENHYFPKMIDYLKEYGSKTLNFQEVL
jgi:orotate phosphoribosyltransferase